MASRNGNFPWFFFTVFARRHDLTPGGGLGGAPPRNHPEPRGQNRSWNERRAQARIELARRQPRSAARGRGMPAASRRNARPRPLRRHRSRAQLCDVVSSPCARYREAATISCERTLSLQRRHYARVDACRAHQFGWDLPRLCGGGGGAHRASDERSPDRRTPRAPTLAAPERGRRPTRCAANFGRDLKREKNASATTPLELALVCARIFFFPFDECGRLWLDRATIYGVDFFHVNQVKGARIRAPLPLRRIRALLK